MGKFLQLILDWSEVWALLLPLAVLSFRPKQPAFFKSVVLYIWAALLLNLIGDVIGDYKKYLPWWLQSNNPLYNLHSIVRFTCFASFFMALKQPHFLTLKKILPVVTLLFLAINFAVAEDFFYTEHLSGTLLTIEAYLLLVYCLLYYLSQLKDDTGVLAEGPDFWVTTGLCIYVVINFFVFLFYVPMIKEDPDLADKMWSVHNIAYIILCFFIAKAFYVPTRPFTSA